MTITEFLLARIAEDEAPTFALHPYECEPGCCAPAGYVGHECLLCQTGTEYGGTVAAITEIAQEHEEKIHRRSRVLAECAAKRAIVEALIGTDPRHEALSALTLEFVVGQLAAIYADHPDYDTEWAR